MEEKIRDMKEQLVRLAESQLKGGAENVDTHEMGMVVDMIKDLAEAEKSCWEAEYYMSVVEAMEDDGRYGYDRQGYDGEYGRQGYQESYYTGNDNRMGYRDSKGRFAKRPNRRGYSRMRQGYSEESVENLRQMMEDADPARKEQLKKDLQNLMREF